MEEQKCTAGKGVEWGTIIIIYLSYCIFIIVGGQNRNRNCFSIKCTAQVQICFCGCKAWIPDDRPLRGGPSAACSCAGHPCAGPGRPYTGTG